MIKVAVLMGGRSGEHDVSLRSGEAVLEALGEGYAGEGVRLERDGSWSFDGGALRLSPGQGLAELERRRPDVVFPALHGPMDEDGTVQAALLLLGIPFVGSGVAASAAAMDKPMTKHIFRGVGIPVAADVTVDANDWRRDAAGICARVLEQVGLPVFVKPARLGSSVGVHKVTAPDALAAAIDDCVTRHGVTLVETLLVGRELTAPVLEDPATGEPMALPLIEIRLLGHDFFDYVAKYTDGHNEEICPAPVDAATTEAVQAIALAAHRALGCRGMSRTDFILTERGPIVLETNTIPGLTGESLIPKSAAAAGLSFAAFVDRLIRCALR